MHYFPRPDSQPEAPFGLSPIPSLPRPHPLSLTATGLLSVSVRPASRCLAMPAGERGDPLRRPRSPLPSHAVLVHLCGPRALRPHPLGPGIFLATVSCLWIEASWSPEGAEFRSDLCCRLDDISVWFFWLFFKALTLQISQKDLGAPIVPYITLRELLSY